VRQVKAGLSFAATDKAFGIPKASLSKWLGQIAKEDVGGAGERAATVASEQMELARMRAEVARPRTKIQRKNSRRASRAGHAASYARSYQMRK
jgi:transposase-like protein